MPKWDAATVKCKRSRDPEPTRSEAPRSGRLNAPARTGERALPVDEQLIGAPQHGKGALRTQATPGFTDKCMGREPHSVSNHSRFPLGIGGLLNTARYTKKDATVVA